MAFSVKITPRAERDLSNLHQELHAGLDVFIVEALVRDVEEVVAAGLVEVEPHIDLVEECLVGLCGLQRRLAIAAD